MKRAFFFQILSAAALATMTAPALAAEPLRYDTDQERASETAVNAAFNRTADPIVIAFDQDVTPTWLLAESALRHWISRIDDNADRVSALCEISLRRGLTSGQSIDQLSVTPSPTTTDRDRYVAAGAYDAFVFFGRTPSRREKVVRVIFTKRATHGEIGCEQAYAILLDSV